MGRIKENSIADADERRRPVSLGQLAQKKIGIFCWCNRCTHNAVVDASQLMAQLGPAVPVPELGGYMRCSGCGAKDIATRPAWPSLGQVSRHEPLADAEDAEVPEADSTVADQPAAQTGNVSSLAAYARRRSPPLNSDAGQPMA